MVFETTGKYQLVNGDDDNFEKIMQAVGKCLFVSTTIDWQVYV